MRGVQPAGGILTQSNAMIKNAANALFCQKELQYKEGLNFMASAIKREKLYNLVSFYILAAPTAQCCAAQRSALEDPHVSET